jgi:hypothetical protein
MYGTRVRVTHNKYVRLRFVSGGRYGVRTADTFSELLKPRYNLLLFYNALALGTTCTKRYISSKNSTRKYLKMLTVSTASMHNR